MRAGLVGHPIDHSLSPCIHAAAYRELGLDWSYELFPCDSADKFSQLITDIRYGEQDIVALNVTTPYKQVALQLCDSRDSDSQVIGGANVLTCASPFGIVGHNSDGRAALRSLCDVGFVPKGAEVVICGTGPVAAATLLALVQERAAAVHILSRDAHRAKQFIKQFADAYQRLATLELVGDEEAASNGLDVSSKVQVPVSYRSETQITAVNQSDLAFVLQQSSALIDATPLGMRPGDPSVVAVELLHSALIVLDTVYGHGETPLLAGARTAEARALDGLAMLVEQAALSIEHWIVDLGMGRMVAPRETMMTAAVAELEARGV